MTKVTHLEDHAHAFLNADNIVEQIAVFAPDAHDDQTIQSFAQGIGFVKAVCCCTYGKPYIGDTWHEASKSWIETAPRTTPEDVAAVE